MYSRAGLTRIEQRRFRYFSERAFYRLRHVIAQELTIAPAAIRPETRLAALLKRVVFGAWDDKAGMAGSVGDLLRHPRLNHAPEVLGGVQSSECAQVLQEFFLARRA